jgi:hypothetical protein
MAYSNVTYTGNGVTTDYTFSFPYLEQSHIGVTVNGVQATFSWVNANTIRLAAAAPNGQAVRISRNSNRQARLSDYQDAQVLTEEQMDYDAKQLFYVAQEAFDAVAEAPVGGDMRRSMNLSDVYDITQSRLNIGAVARTGDTMLGPLLLAGAPAVPNEAATKAYVDQKTSVAGGGVTSFNTRTGAVTLLGADVTGALGYSPVNKAGDVMTGALTLPADPLNPLQAATKQYVDNRIPPGLFSGEWQFPAPNPAKAAAYLNKTQTANTSDRAGSMNMLLERTGGTVPMVGLMHTYKVTSPYAVGAVGDIGIGSLMIGNAATFLSGWFAAVGPRVNPGQGWAAVGLKVNAVERVGDQGFRGDRTGGSYTMGIQVSPDNTLNVGDGPPTGYNMTFGVGFIASAAGAGASRIWNPIYIEQDSTVFGGVHIQSRGGSAPSTMPRTPMSVTDHFYEGIDFRFATFNDADNTAIHLAQSQCIHFGPVSRIYQAPGGDLTFYDPLAGSKTLSSLVGGGGGFDPAVDHTFTGKNTFSKSAGAIPAYTVRVQSLAGGALTPGGIILDSGYDTSLDVRKVTNVGVEPITGGGNAGVYIQHQASGTSGGGVVAGLRVQADTTHAGASGSVNSYGVAVEVQRSSLIGNTVGFMARVTGAGGYYDSTVGFLAAPGGDGSKKFQAAFAAGSPFTGVLNCDFGLNLSMSTCNTAAIWIPSNKPMGWSTDLTITERFDAAAGHMKVAQGGVQRIGMSISGANPSTIYQNDGSGYGSYYIDTSGGSQAVISCRSGSRTTGPSNPSAIANWLRVDVDGIVFYWPLYR